MIKFQFVPIAAALQELIDGAEDDEVQYLAKKQFAAYKKIFKDQIISAITSKPLAKEPVASTIKENDNESVAENTENSQSVPDSSMVEQTDNSETITKEEIQEETTVPGGDTQPNEIIEEKESSQKPESSEAESGTSLDGN